MSASELAGRLDKESLAASLPVAGQSFRYFSLAKLRASGVADVDRLPFSLKIVLENLIRNDAAPDHIEDLGRWTETRAAGGEILFHPARLMMPESSGLPLIADLAAMRDAVVHLGGDPAAVNPIKPVDIIVDHSVTVDFQARADALQRNMALEYERNAERYAFLRWAQGAFKNLRVVPPGVGICHQINLECLAKVVWREGTVVYPDTIIATDSHTPMINALGVLGWGAGGLEAAAAMLGQPITMRIPAVIGCRLSGRLRPGLTGTDVALTVTQALRARGVVQAFVEFFGTGLDGLSVMNRATIANMAPEYGATVGYFPIDRQVVSYLAETGRTADQVELVEAYARAQGLWRDETVAEPVFSDIVNIDLDRIEPIVAGPKRPQDRHPLRDVPAAALAAMAGEKRAGSGEAAGIDTPVVRDRDIVIAAITSCTNAGNPELMVQAGLVARKARERGLSSKPWVRTSMGPASHIISGLLEDAGLQADLDALGFQVVGFGCTTCVGNSGPLAPPIAKAIDEQGLTVAAVSSSNRNFEGRTHPQCRLHFLASPPLVVAFALAGSLDVNLDSDPLGVDPDGNPVRLADLWPSAAMTETVMAGLVTPDTYRRRNAHLFDGDERWLALPRPDAPIHRWDDESLYLRRPPFFDDVTGSPNPIDPIVGARVLVQLGDSITTDHISPVGTITEDSAAGKYLLSLGVAANRFNNFASRRINHHVMIRGTFANVRLRNHLVPNVEGGFTRVFPDDRMLPIHEAASLYRERNEPMIVLAGKEYGAGSSRDWAAKGTALLGVRAVIAESFERIHRSNLVDMAVLPLEFEEDGGWQSLGLEGTETFDIHLDTDTLRAGARIAATIRHTDGRRTEIELRCRIDTGHELDYFRHGGILPYMLRELLHGDNSGTHGRRN